MDADLLAYRAHIRTVNQPFKTVGGRNLHLIVNAFKNQVGDNAFKGSLFRLYQIDVFRTDNHVYRLVYAETTVHTGKFCAEDLYQLIMAFSPSADRTWASRKLASPMKSATNLDVG